MNTKRKSIIIIVVVILCICAAVMLASSDNIKKSVYFGIQRTFNLPIDEPYMIELFEEDKELLNRARDYIIRSGMDHVYIIFDPYYEETYSGFDKSFSDILEELRRKGYEIISGDESYICFFRWVGSYGSRGFVFSRDGNMPQIDFVIKYAELSEENWYYYNENYEDWRVQQAQD